MRNIHSLLNYCGHGLVKALESYAPHTPAPGNLTQNATTSQNPVKRHTSGKGHIFIGSIM